MVDIGEMGEHLFSYWCSEIGVVCNGSKVDKTGWDFFVEFNDPLDKSIPLDMHPSRIEAKIQVKSTQSNKRSVQVSLSNLQRLATAIQPAFFIFIEFDEKYQFIRAYLKHIDHDLIGKILLRLRKASASNKANEIHKLEMVIKYDSITDNEIKNGYDLRKAILQFIPNGLDAYQKNKSAILSKIGFENGYGRINFTLNEKDIENFIDMSLGLNKSVVLSNAKFFNSRFGIDIEDNRFAVTGQPSTLQITDVKPRTTGIIKFIAENSNSPSIDFPCELYIPIPLKKSDQLKKIRVKGEVFDFFLLKEKLNFEFHIQNGEIDFRLIYKIVKLLHWINDCNYIIRAEIIFDKYPPIKINNLGIPESLNSYVELWSIVEAAKYLINLFDLLDVDVSLSTLQNSGYSLVGLRNFLDIQANQIKFSFNLDDYTSHEIENFAVVCSFFALLGKITFCLFVGIEGKAIPISDSKYILQARAVNIHKKLVFTESEIPDSEQLESFFKAVEEHYINISWVVIRVPDFNIFTPSTP